MGRRLRLTGLGAVVIATLVVCGALVVVAGSPVNAIAALVGTVILLVLAGEGLTTRGVARKREVLEAQARPRRAAADPLADPVESPDSGLRPRRVRDP